MNYKISLFFCVVITLSMLIISGCVQQPTAQTRPTTWIFKLKGDYSGNYIGVINYYNDTDTYRSFGTLPIEKNYIHELNHSYFAMSMPDSEDMAKRTAILDKKIPKISEHSFGDSIEMNKDEFYTYVIEEHPLIELYFCNVPKADLILLSSELFKGEINDGCRKIDLDSKVSE